MSLTEQQKQKLRVFALAYAKSCHHGTGAGPWHALCSFVDALADARVVAFAQGAVLANDVAKHCENTLEQYVLLGLGGKS